MNTLSPEFAEYLRRIAEDPRSACIYFSIDERVPSMGCGPCEGESIHKTHDGFTVCRAHWIWVERNTSETVKDATKRGRK